MVITGVRENLAFSQSVEKVHSPFLGFPIRMNEHFFILIVLVSLYLGALQK